MKISQRSVDSVQSLIYNQPHANLDISQVALELLLGIIVRASIKQTGLAAIELLVALVSLFLAFWPAMQIVAHFQSGWRWVVAAAVFVVVYAAAYFVLLVGFIRALGSLCERWERRRQKDENTNIDA